ncbi:DctP family TRAP transporter solute-binding subunit [Parasulfitobacter algicola]|uniref:DctP family TRAP transporter solute-binding subunit n=1 Tax=Parasulfitobacter algicola TaxID=2614809 RepID=A0ABX2IKG9_9RHOB|nr:DctP family TRAP transporter solute-binding subunit [Sulfitobacter algicola]NSX53371.1 DctP family TRAP transporter solute-binding subunit [Sulfitobacter algicola]
MNVVKCTLAAVALSLPLVTQVQASCEAGEVKVVMSLVTAVKGHPKGETASALAERVNTQMNGRMCMEVYGSSELYNDDDVFQAMLDGKVQMAAPSFSKFSAYTQKLQMFDLPFLFDDPVHALDFLASEGAQKLREEVRPAGFVGMGFWSNGMKQISSTRVLRKPSDAAGLTFRVQPSDVIEAQFNQMGASTKRLAFSKVYGALESGEVQGQQNTWSNIYTKDFHTVQNGVTESNHAYLGYLVVMPASFLDSLSRDMREEFVALFELTTHEYNRFSFETNQLRRQDIIDEEVLVIRLTDEEKQVWRDTFTPVYDQFSNVVGQDLIDAVRAAKSE